MAELPKSGHSVREIECPSCGGALEIVAAGFTTNLICQYCGSELDVMDDQTRLVAEHAEAGADLEIPLGTRGTLRGIEWAAIGYMQKNDGWGRWDDYLLFNPYHGYRWLTRSGGGWSFGTPLMSLPASATMPSFNYGGKRFSSFNANMQITTEYVLGEFYWQAQKGDQVISSDYVAGDRMLSVERSGDEISWTMGEWIPFADIQDGFGTSYQPEWPRTGAPPLPHQPSPYGKGLFSWAMIAIGAVVLALVIGIATGSPSDQKTTDITVRYGQPAQEKTMGPFTVKGRGQAFTVQTDGEVANNSYVDFDFKLVDRTTGKEINAPTALEYYSGRDSEGNWVEKTNSATLKFSNVPAGTYDLEIEATPSAMNRAYGSAHPVRISAYTGGFFVSNFILFLFLLAMPVIWRLWQHLRFAQHRHSESDAADYDDD